MLKNHIKSGEGSKYTCPEFMLEDFIRLCEDCYVDKIHGNKEKYIVTYGCEKYLEMMVKLYIAFFIMYAFDERIYKKYSNGSTDFFTFINNCIDKSDTKTKLKFFEVLAEEKEFKHHYRCRQIIKGILDKKKT